MAIVQTTVNGGLPLIMDSADIDTENLRMLKDLLEARFSELVETFIKDSETRVRAMAEGLKNSDLDLVCNQAHSLKGSGRNLGANSLADLCDTLESQSRGGEIKNGPQQLAAIEQKVAAVTEILRQYL